MTTKEFELNPEIPVTRETPPTFLLQNEDDHVDGVKQSLVYYIALKKAGVPVEMHLYRARRACVRAAAHEAAGDSVAPVGGGVAGLIGHRVWRQLAGRCRAG